MDHRMSIVSTVDVLREEVADLKAEGKSIAFVPTMGSLHEGHVSLIKMAREKADAVVASLFVNPEQFGHGEDLDAYPRSLAEDVRVLEGAMADVVFTPTVEEMYPDGYATSVSVERVTEGLCSITRPVHFAGVATIVTKFLMMVMPDVAIFGEKDFQQLVMIRQMVKDLNIPVKIIGAPIIRDDDGLALSSRNEFLPSQERTVAPKFYEALAALSVEIGKGEDIEQAIAKAHGKLDEIGFEVEYIELRSSETLAPLTVFNPDEPARILAAVKIGATRLIDNLAVKD